jgi:hypothetical protein
LFTGIPPGSSFRRWCRTSTAISKIGASVGFGTQTDLRYRRIGPAYFSSRLRLLASSGPCRAAAAKAAGQPGPGGHGERTMRFSMRPCCCCGPRLPAIFCVIDNRITDRSDLTLSGGNYCLRNI